MKLAVIFLFIASSLFPSEPQLNVVAEYSPSGKSGLFSFLIKVNYRNIPNAFTDNPLSVYSFSIRSEDGKYAFGSRLESPMLSSEKKYIQPDETVMKKIELDSWLKGIGHWEKDWNEIINSGQFFVFICTVESRYGYFESRPLKFRIRK